MKLTLAFDVYGTLIDTQGIATALAPFIGGADGETAAARAAELARLWREKQLEYTFRRAAMHRYTDFDTVTAQALDYCTAVFKLELADTDRATVLGAYRRLPAFADAVACLEQARAAGHALYAFSNGTAATVNGLLESAGLRRLLDGVVSVEALGTFKPDPAVYAQFCASAAVRPDQAWLVSGNPFDVIGAVSAGMNAAWVQRRAGACFDPWGIAPTRRCDSLAGLLDAIALPDASGRPAD